MTFEQAITALKQGKKVSRVVWESDDKYPRSIELVKDYDNPLSPYFRMIDKDNDLYGTNVMSVHDDDVMADDWEICGEENQPDKSGVSIGELLCKVTANFDEYEQALDKFRCRLEDLRETAEKLNGIKLDINIDFDRG